MEILKSKRFVVRQTLIGKNQVIEFTNKKGDVITYDHDKAFKIMQSSLESLGCWIKYKSYTASGNVPMSIRGTDAMISRVDAIVEAVVEAVTEVVDEVQDIATEEMESEATYEAAF